MQDEAMTLRVVADNTVELPVHNPKLIPSVARAFANKAEAGEFGAIDRAVLILETDTGPLSFYWGEELTHYEAIGMLQMAAHLATVDGIDAFLADD
jgi:hypothetical protein